MWAKMFEIMVDESDKAHLIDMRKKYKNILRNYGIHLIKIEKV